MLLETPIEFDVLSRNASPPQQLGVWAAMRAEKGRSMDRCGFEGGNLRTAKGGR